MARPAILAGLGALAVLFASGCSGPRPAASSPSSVTSGTGGSSAPSATPVAAASTPASLPSATPAPSTSGDLDASVFPARLGRWKAVPGSGDEETYQPNGSWVHALDARQAVSSLVMQACTTPRTLPTPAHVLVSDYQDAQGRRAVGQALRFDSAARASAFVDAYAANIRGCVGRSNPMAATLLQAPPVLVDRRTMLADGTRWVEVVRNHGTLVRMFVANEQDQPLGDAELKALVAAA